MEKLSNRLKMYRNKLYLSQEYVANVMNLNRATIAQIELGNRKVTADELLRFSQLFGVTTDSLLMEDETEMPVSIFARGFEELDEKDREEILSLMRFKKLMKEQQK